jgi:hypothetical protein
MMKQCFLALKPQSPISRVNYPLPLIPKKIKENNKKMNRAGNRSRVAGSVVQRRIRSAIETSL